MDPLPLYSKKTLADVQSMAPEIIAAAARYGVPAEAIAGSLAQEQFDQTASYWNEVKRTGSTYLAIRFLGEALERGAKINPSDPLQGASSYIQHWYNSDPNAITVGSDAQKKLKNGLLIDYGPAGVKFQNAIHAILNNPDDPGFAPYRNDLFSAGVALQNGSDKALLASSMAAYLRDGLGVYQSNMSVNGDPTTGINTWNGLSPELQRALLVQFYKQGPTPERVLSSKWNAAQNHAPYIPQIGADGAGATYLANRAAVAQALADAPTDFAGRWNAMPATASTDVATPSVVAAPDDGSREEVGKRATIRRLARVPATGEGQSAFDAGAPAVPFVPASTIRPGRSAAFDERFPASTPPAGASSGSMTQLSPFSGLPMRYLPPSVFGLPDNSDVAQTDFNDWLAGLIRPRARR